MADLNFIPEPTANQPTVWFVHDRADKRLVGSVEWHNVLGGYGFAPAEVDAELLSNASAALQIGAFLQQVNAQTE